MKTISVTAGLARSQKRNGSTEDGKSREQDEGDDDGRLVGISLDPGGATSIWGSVEPATAIVEATLRKS